MVIKLPETITIKQPEHAAEAGGRSLVTVTKKATRGGLHILGDGMVVPPVRIYTHAMTLKKLKMKKTKKTPNYSFTLKMWGLFESLEVW